MSSPIFSLVIVFAVIVVLLALHRPLYQSILGGLILTVFLYHIPLQRVANLTLNVFRNWGSLSVLLSLYLITYLQRQLEARQQIKLAQRDLDGLVHNRRVNAAVAPLFIGLLPSAAAMILCGDIVNDATRGYLTPRQQAFVTNWFRHIPESTLPTYTGVLLMTSLSGVPLPGFMVAMIVPMICLGLIGWFPYLCRIPKDPGTPLSGNRWADAVHLFQHLWSLLLILVLILAFHLNVVVSVLIVIATVTVIYRFNPGELVPMVRSAFEVKLILNTFLVLVLKEFFNDTGVLTLLPKALSVLPIPMYLIFALLFFFGGCVSGSNGIIAMGTPLAFAAIPGGGVPLMVLLMCMSHAASQISPTHVCLVVASDYYRITLGQLVRANVLPCLLFCTLMVGYYNILRLIL